MSTDIMTKAALQNLPAEIVHQIIIYLDIQDIHNIGMLTQVFLEPSKSIIWPLRAFRANHGAKAAQWSTTLDAHRKKILRTFCVPTFNKKQLQSFSTVSNPGLFPGKTRLPETWTTMLNNCPNLRTFETMENIDLGDLSTKEFTHLGVPACTDLHDHDLDRLQSLEIYYASNHQYVHLDRTSGPRGIPLLPALLSLYLELPQLNDLDLENVPDVEKLWITNSGPSNTSIDLLTGISSSIMHLVLVGPFIITSQRKFGTLLHRLSSNTIRTFSCKNLVIQGEKTTNTHEWPSMWQLRSVELIGSDPRSFQHMPWHGVRKIMLGYHDLIPTKLLSKIVKSAQHFLESLIIYTLPQNDLGLGYRDSNQAFRTRSYVICSAAFVQALTRCTHLKHLQLIGGYFFTVDDWKALCVGVFKTLDIIHVEQPGSYPDITCEAYKNTYQQMAPSGLISLHEGRLFVRPNMATESMRANSNMQYTTQDIQQIVLRHIDPECLFSISHGSAPSKLVIVNDSGEVRRSSEMDSYKWNHPVGVKRRRDQISGSPPDRLNNLQQFKRSKTFR